MAGIKIGDYVRDKLNNQTGIVVFERYERQHQYLERDLYYDILVSDGRNAGKIVKALSYDCDLIREIDIEDSSSKR